MTQFNINTQLLQEDPFYLSEALQFLPQAETAAQVKSWATNGNIPRKYRHKREYTGDKPRVKLEVIQLPEGLATSVPAFFRFIEALNEE